MIVDYLTGLAVVILLIVLLYKLYNLLVLKEFSAFNISAPLIIGIVCFLFLFIGLNAQLSYEKSIEEYDSGNTLQGTYDIVSNDYYAYSLYMDISWVIFLIMIMITIGEIMYAIYFYSVKSIESAARASGSGR